MNKIVLNTPKNKASITSLNTALSPILWTKRIAAIDLSPTQRFNISWKNVDIPRAILLTLFAIIVVYQCSEPFSKPLVQTKHVRLDAVLNFVISSVVFWTRVVAVFFTLKHSKKHALLMKSFEILDSKINMLGYSINHVPIRRLSLLCVILVLLQTTLLTGLIVLGFCNFGFCRCLIKFISHLQSTICTNIVCAEEIIILYALTMRFEKLNEALLDTKYLSGASRYRNSISDRISAKVIVYRDVHFHLCELTEELNSIFTFPTAMIVFESFVKMFIPTYKLIAALTSQNILSSINIVILAIVYILEAVIKIYFLSRIGDLVKKESKKTGVLLQEISIHFEGRNLQKQILNFSLQIFQKKINITACGLFPIDNTLIFHICYTFVSFLVIVGQFSAMID